MKTKMALGILMLFALTFNACKKPKDGEIGPAGPAGTNGNANVVSSNTVTLNNWVEDFNDGTDYWYHSDVSWSAITQAIKDKGVVMVYFDDGAGNWVALPFTNAGAGDSQTINFSFKAGSVTIIINGFEFFNTYTASDFNGIVVRIVAIASSSRMAHPEVDLKNYKEVKKAFNLKD